MISRTQSEKSTLSKGPDSGKDDGSEISVKSYKTGPVKKPKKLSQDPRSKSDDKISSRQDKGKKPETKSTESIASDGFDTGSDSIEKSKVKSIETMDSSLRTRKTSVSSIIKEGVGKATRFLRTLTVKTRPIRRQSSIIFLGNQGQTVRNTGFAFSQDAGVSSAVTTSPEK